jgi:hypothetical protein
MSKEIYLVYLMNGDGTYGKPVMKEGLQEAVEYAVIQADYPEIRVCDMLDCLVFHIKRGKIVFPEMSAAAPVDEGTALTQSNDRPIPYVVFVADLPTVQGDLPELALPFAHAVDVKEAVKMAEEAHKGEPNYVVLDAMDYNRLMEIADMLEEEEPSYSKEGAEVEWRPLDIGWAVRRLKKGAKVRFNTWNKGEYIENRGGRIVDRTGTSWRPSQEEIMTSGWEVADYEE